MSDGETANTNPVRCISYLTWMSFNTELKNKLVGLFGIERSGHTIVHSGVLPDGSIGSHVQSDGYTIQDLQAISLEKLQELLGAPKEDDNFYSLLETLVKNIDDFVEPVGGQEFFDDKPIELPADMPVDDSVKDVVINEEQFVPAPYEDILKKSKKPITPKDGKHAKTTKAKGTKTK